MKHSFTRTLRLAAVVAIISYSSIPANAQERTSTYTPKPQRQSRISGNSSVGSLSALLPPTRESTPLQLGPVLFRPGISYRYTSTESISQSVSNLEDTDIKRTSLSLAFDYLDLWSLNVNPSWTSYTNDRFEDDQSNSVNFSTGFMLQDWQLGITQSYRESNNTLVETASQTQQESWGTTLGASKQLSSVWNIDFNIDQDQRTTTAFADMQQFSVASWLRHQTSPAFNSSIGVTKGYADVDPGLDTKFTQFLLRFGFQPTDKLTVSLQGGIDSREIDAPDSGKKNKPKYTASLQYQPLDYTTIGISLSRSISASYFSNLNSENESLTFSLRQRLLERFFFTASYGERSSVYLDLLENFAVGRDDIYESFSLSLSTILLNRINTSVFYGKNENVTNLTGYGFSSNQTGFNISFQY